MKKYYLLIIACGLGIGMQAQELDCKVNILLPQQVISPPELFGTMKSTITEFISNRKWTRDDWSLMEKIECTMQITISKQVDIRTFEASIQVTSSRPVYNSDYKTPVLNVNDRDFTFTFQENTMIQWSNDQHRDNLSSVLAYYANMIVAMDYDTFSMEGGTDNFLICQTIVNNAQSTADAGWKANEKGQQNRYWLIENILTQTFKPIRQCLYDYHRHGMDKLFQDVEGARKTMAEALLELKNIHKIKPSSFNMQVFWYAKADEVVNLFKPVPVEEKQRIYELCKLIDPGNISKYEKMMN
ncbi:MAG: DUF4835 family protein [Flavobacteriales bacterium]